MFTTSKECQEKTFQPQLEVSQCNLISVWKEDNTHSDTEESFNCLDLYTNIPKMSQKNFKKCFIQNCRFYNVKEVRQKILRHTRNL